MKSLIAAVLLFAAGAATAGPLPGALLVKSVTPGFVMPEYSTSYNCYIYQNYVEIQTSAGGLTAVRTTRVTIGGTLMKLIEDADKGTITKTPAPTDGPITRFTAILPSGTGSTKDVLLKALGSEIADNSAPAAVTLINFINQLCD